MTHIEWLQLNSLANKILGEKELRCHLLLDAFPRFTRVIHQQPGPNINHRFIHEHTAKKITDFGQTVLEICA